MDCDQMVRRMVTFKSEDGSCLQTVDIPVTTEAKTLVKVLNSLLGKEKDEFSSYRLYLNDKELTTSLQDGLTENELNDTETVLDVLYIEEANFLVNPITRCTSSIPGHAEAITCVAYSPKGHVLATGSGDTTVRIWDTNTQTPYLQLQGHKHWVLCVAWCPEGQQIASADKNGVIIIWNAETGQSVGKHLTSHTKWVTSLAWEPYHLNADCRHLASGSKDGTIRVWDTKRSTSIKTLTSHTSSVMSVKWGATGLIYSASQDRTIKIWRAVDGVLCRTIEGHAHWVNTLALNTEHVLKHGKHAGRNLEQVAKKVEKVLTANGGEIFASGSDDMTVILWSPKFTQIARLTGHQQLINDVKFSPDGRTLASASYDKTIRLWDAVTGKFLCVFRGHVQQVYVIAWSPDSRLLLSGSADSTLKIWDCRKRKLAQDLPGHADDVYGVDWAMDGMQAASGGKDKAVRLWRP